LIEVRDVLRLGRFQRQRFQGPLVQVHDMNVQYPGAGGNESEWRFQPYWAVRISATRAWFPSILSANRASTFRHAQVLH
jgi:hypothetical protein